MRSESRAVDALLLTVIVLLTLATGYIHSTLGGVMLTLNALGYFTLAGAVVVSAIFFRRFLPLVLIALAGYAAVTIVGWMIMGPYYSTAYLAKAIEIEGWDYPRHLAGRAFAVVVHGDTDGVHDVRRALTDWLSDIGLIQAGAAASLGRYIDYYGKYATSHDALDRDSAFQLEVRNAAHALAAEVKLLQQGRKEPDDALTEPRPK